MFAEDSTGSIWHQYVSLLGDAPHWLFEITLILVFDVLIGLMLWPQVKRWIARHDTEHHAGHMSPTTPTIELPGYKGPAYIPPIKDQEWRDLLAIGATTLEPGKPYWVRVNEDGTFAIGRMAKDERHPA